MLVAGLALVGASLSTSCEQVPAIAPADAGQRIVFVPEPGGAPADERDHSLLPEHEALGPANNGGPQSAPMDALPRGEDAQASPSAKCGLGAVPCPGEAPEQSPDGRPSDTGGPESNPESGDDPSPESGQASGQDAAGAPNADPGDPTPQNAEQQPEDQAGGSDPGLACGMLESGDTIRIVSVSGLMRSYRVHVPEGHDGQTPMPLVLDLHELQGDDGIQMRNSGYVAVADRETFMLAHPLGLGGAWNVGPCCTRAQGVDDVTFLRAVVSDIASIGCLDPKRVYAAGFNLGGGMAHFLACHAADVFAAVAPAGFDLLEENVNGCQPARPVSVISFRGAQDNIVSYAGGALTPPSGLQVTIHSLGAERTFETWGRINGCTDTPTPSPDGCSFYKACRGGVEVGLCAEPNGRHRYGDPDVGWDFLSRFTLP